MTSLGLNSPRLTTFGSKISLTNKNVQLKGLLNSNSEADEQVFTFAKKGPLPDELMDTFNGGDLPLIEGGSLINDSSIMKLQKGSLSGTNGGGLHFKHRVQVDDILDTYNRFVLS